MSWLARLYETYEAGMALDSHGEAKLMPISHTLQNAHINIVIDGDGNFKRASVLEKTQVVLPATEKSAGRSSGEAPHPLADKIQYIAKDYPDFGGKKKPYFPGYEQQLTSWCNSEFAHSKAVAVHKYIFKGKVVADLASANVLQVDENNKLLARWPYDTDKDNPSPLIFKVLPTLPKEKRENKDRPEVEQGDALVCWSVERDGEPNSSTWKDENLQQKWIAYDTQPGDDFGFCFVAGEDKAIAVNHPAKLRHTGDKAKLISANDSSGFTFRGRFTDKHGVQAVSVSFEATQKAHNALRWLISRQGFRNGDQVYVSWAVSGKETPDPLAASYDLFNVELIKQKKVEDEKGTGVDHTIDLGSSFAQNLKKYLAGYHAKLEPNEQIVIMGLDAATPGRMGVIYYRELLASEFLNRIELWHSHFAWFQRYTKELPEPKGKKKSARKTIWPVSSPAPRVIAEAAYGDILKSNDTLKKSVIERIMPCIVDGRAFPRDLMVLAVRRASNRVVKRLPDQFSNLKTEKAAWEKHLGVACALFKGFCLRHPDKNKRREYTMALEEERTTRDYLYGRLLAIAERIEEMALQVGGEARPTNASRLMQRFADRPFSTWRNIFLGLQPYMQRLQSSRTGFLVNRKKELDAVLAAFKPEDFTSEKALSGEFLLGYHCQRQAWQQTNNDEKSEE